MPLPYLACPSHNLCKCLLMTVEEVFVDVDDVERISFPLLSSIVTSSISASINARQSLLAAEGLQDCVNLMGVILMVELNILDVISNDFSLAQWLLSTPFEDVCKEIINIASDFSESVSILAVRLRFRHLPLLPPLRVASPSFFYTETQYQVSPEGNLPFSKIMILDGIALDDCHSTRVPIASYYRCLNDRCRAETSQERFQTIGFSAKKGASKISVPKCHYCRVNMIPLPLLAVDELQSTGLFYVSDWNKAIPYRAHFNMAIKRHRRCRLIGYPSLRVESNSFEFIVCDAYPLPGTTTQEQSLPVAIRGESAISDLFSCLDCLLKELQLIKILLPTASVAVIAEDDPWLKRRVLALYGEENCHASPSLSTIAESKQVIIVSPRMLKPGTKLMNQICTDYDCVFDWTRQSTEVSHLVCDDIFLELAGRFNEFDQFFTVASCRLIDSKIRWSEGAIHLMQQYHLRHRNIVCSRNDDPNTLIPLHQPTRQLKLLSSAAEVSASVIHGREEVLDVDVAIAAFLGEILVKHRFGDNSNVDFGDETSIAADIPLCFPSPSLSSTTLLSRQEPFVNTNHLYSLSSLDSLIENISDLFYQ